MNRRTGHQTVRSARQPTAWHRWRAAAAAVAVVTGAAVLTGWGHEVLGTQPGRAPASAATDLAVAGNSGCVQATPVVERALGVLTRLERGAVTAADARHLLAAELTGIERLARATPDDVLQESLANAFDAFTAFRAVMLNPHAPAYPGTFSNLAGTLRGFRRTCSVANSDFATGTRGWAADNGNTVLTRSATAHDAHWSLHVANAGTSPAPVGFTDSPSWLSTTLKGSEQIGLWARAITGAPMLTLQVQELVGRTILGSRRVTMRLDSAFRFEYLTYKVRRPGTSRLSVTVSAADLAPGEAFLVDDITIMRN